MGDSVEQQKRRYTSPDQVARDAWQITRRFWLIPGALMGGTVSHAFRERIMMVITTVNQCAACSYVHSRAALLSGVTEEELETILSGSVEGFDEHESHALLFAQHWADNDGRADVEMRRKLVEHYGERTADCIEVVAHAIRMGNLTGNSIEYWRRRLLLPQRSTHP
jgi:AhpD family alkylhydroperoxidase